MPLPRSRLTSRPPRPGQTPRSQKKRLLIRVLVALMAGLCLVGLQRLGLLDQLTGRTVLPSNVDWNNDYPLIQHLRTLVVRRGLTSDSADCLLFIVNGNDPPDAVRMRVMEKHSGSCPGPKGTLPQLFTLQVDRTAHTVRTDSGTPGQFHDLP